MYIDSENKPPNYFWVNVLPDQTSEDLPDDTKPYESQGYSTTLIL
jgi:hypothetical protein